MVRAPRSGLSNCVLWVNERTSRRVLGDRELRTVEPLDIKRRLIAYVKSGGEVIQAREQREDYRAELAFYYKAIVPAPGFPKGIFIEIRLNGADPDCPIVHLVSAHRQRR